MRSDARKRLAEEIADQTSSHYLHPDAAVRQLIDRERQKAAEQGWDEGATFAAPYGGGYLRSVLICNPYRIETTGGAA